MSEQSQMDDSLKSLVGRAVVLDLASRYVCIGTLTSQDPYFFVLEDADMHDLRDTSTTREVYVLDSKRHGINANRKQVRVRREEVVGISALDDVLI